MNKKSIFNPNKTIKKTVTMVNYAERLDGQGQDRVEQTGHQKRWNKIMKRWRKLDGIRVIIFVIVAILTLGSFITVMVLRHREGKMEQLYESEGVEVKATITEIERSFGFQRTGYCIYTNEEGSVVRARIKINSLYIEDGEVLKGSYLPSDPSLVFFSQDFETSVLIERFFKICMGVGFFLLLLINIFSPQIVTAID